MSNPKPLQDGDRSTDFSERQTSEAADRRPDTANDVDSFAGTHRAPSLTSGEPPLFKCGYIEPTAWTRPPYSVINNEGDTSGDGTKIHEVDIYAYGDDYDPTAPTRSRNVTSDWKMDTDFDGQPN